MNTLSENDPTMEEQASLWAARLDGDSLTEELRRELQAWLAGDERRRAALATYCQFSADLESSLPALAAAGSLPRPARPRRRRAWRPWVLGAGLAAAALAVVALWPFAPGTQSGSFATPVAQRESLTLADGSTVELDARTSLQVDLDGSLRRLRLAEGEAFFSVTKDPARPFVVETPLGSVRVKGTKFDVRAVSPDELAVTVQEGVVQINPALAGASSAPIVLHATDQLILDPSGATVRPLDARQLDDALAWREGRVVFDGTPLRAALARFARHHGVGITVAADAANLRIGGRFPIDDLNGFLATLEEIAPVHVSRNLNGTVHVERRKSAAASNGQGD